MNLDGGAAIVIDQKGQNCSFGQKFDPKIFLAILAEIQKEQKWFLGAERAYFGQKMP